MTFEFTCKSSFDFLTEFSKKFHIPVFDNCLTIPASMGKGYIKKVEFRTDFRLLIHHYNLKEDFIIKRNAAVESNDLINIYFYNNQQLNNLIYNTDKPIQFSQSNKCAIQFTSSDMSSVVKFPANSETNYCIIGITASRLSGLLRIEKPNSIIKEITSGSTPLFIL